LWAICRRLGNPSSQCHYGASSPLGNAMVADRDRSGRMCRSVIRHTMCRAAAGSFPPRRTT
jgi:hypothetical protein